VSISPTNLKYVLPVPYQRRRLPESGLGETTLHTEGGHFFQDGATEGPEDRRRDADANLIFQVGPTKS
jgi:hypothetical protein